MSSQALLGLREDPPPRKSRFQLAFLSGIAAGSPEALVRRAAQDRLLLFVRNRHLPGRVFAWLPSPYVSQTYVLSLQYSRLCIGTLERLSSLSGAP